MNKIAEDILAHYGTPKHSGRYKWGSGDDPHQHSGDFLSRVDDLKRKGLSETAIAEAIGIKTSELRIQVALANDERRIPLQQKAVELKDKGYSLMAIAKEMGFKNDSSVRSLLNENSKLRMNQARNTAEFLKEQVDKKGMILLGEGVEKELNISREKLAQAVYIAKMEDYVVYDRRLTNHTNPGKYTTLRVLCPPGTPYKDVYKTDELKSLFEYSSTDGGETFTTFKYPKSLDSKRVAIRYAEDGGIHKDGVIELRRGVDDISLGNSKYAQVRILVDDKKYLKGMAVYSDDKDMPPGVDIVFNTNKGKKVSKLDVMKNIEPDPDNPFGSLIKSTGQRTYIDKDGKEQLSVINKRAEEGDWAEWKDKLPSQFLAKQNVPLIKKQLASTVADKYAEFDEINALDNPTIKKTLLKSFADDCDASAVHLKTAALPGQKYQVILPFKSIKDNEVFAPNFAEGTQVALVRFPHGGTFEIPILTVNNKNKEAIKTISLNPKDAVGINSKVAERLSGADFDGDTVMVVPQTSKVKISSTPPLKGLEGFDNKLLYGPHETKTVTIRNKDTGKDEEVVQYYQNGKRYKTMKNTQVEMGVISNLITDITLKGADDGEKARAVRHSMVVIDAEKHHLNYKKSYEDNNIAQLKKYYQGAVNEEGKYHEGASTLLSRSKSELRVDKKRGTPWINPDTGAYEWERINPKTGKFESKIVTEEYVDSKGKTQKRMHESTRMFEAKDARTLISDLNTPQEQAYAEYANNMKALGNQARKEMISTGKINYSADANKQYRSEVDSLNRKLDLAIMNKPRERTAQAIADSSITAKKKANLDMTKPELKKLKQQEVTRARIMVGAKRNKFDVTDTEWLAIQSGAIHENKLKEILENTDMDALRQRATPKVRTVLSQAKINKIQSMVVSGYSTTEIAESLQVSSSVVSEHIK